MNSNRRNYYRILRVQPDASEAVIRSNYRTLLQKLKLHPDLGGDDWNASLINRAYDTLRNPARRKQYDEELLEEFHIHTLSRGHLKSDSIHSGTAKQDEHGNHRNYYRVLNIQPDAPNVIIQASCRTLMKQAKSLARRALLKQAETVLLDTNKRRQYDQLIELYHHHEAIEKLTEDEVSQNNEEQQHSHKAQENSTGQTRDTAEVYRPIIHHYCPFCKTPYQKSTTYNTEFSCLECNSPLTPADDHNNHNNQRALTRISKTGQIYYYQYWPGRKYSGAMADLSPSGCRFKGHQAIDEGEILKIDAGSFQAIGEVLHNSQDNSVGLRFLTVRFEEQRGQFVSFRL